MDYSFAATEAELDTDADEDSRQRELTDELD
jgi:hypothetical protein